MCPSNKLLQGLLARLNITPSKTICRTMLQGCEHIVHAKHTDKASCFVDALTSKMAYGPTTASHGACNQVGREWLVLVLPKRLEAS